MSFKKDFDNSYPISCLFDRAYVHIMENNELEAEGVHSIVEYNGAVVILNMGKFNLSVEGSGLMLKNLSKTSLTVLGEFEKIAFTIKGL